MRFGLFGGPVRRGTGEAADRDAYRAYVETVEEAEALGFYGVYLVEHHFSGRGQVSASLALLAHLAARTSRIRLGTAVVVVPWHNPLLLAEQAATVDVLSQGRLDLGVGRGYRDREFDGFGIPRSEAEERFQETVSLLRTAWTSPEGFSFESPRWRFRDVAIEPRPVQRPHPPLWMGAASERSITEAAREGYRLFLDQVGTFEQCAERLGIYRRTQSAMGRAGCGDEVALTRPLLLARNDGERAALLESHLATLEQLASGARDAAANPFYSDPARRRETAEDGAILGTAEECIERLRRLQTAGIEQVLFTRTTVEGLRRFAAEVMPAFAPPASGGGGNRAE